MRLYRITRVSPRPPSTLAIAYDDGAEVLVDFAPLIRAGGVYTALGDPTLFSQADVGDGGRFVTWPGEIDFCADALRLVGEGREALAS
jgi:hypothetical protein